MKPTDRKTRVFLTLPTDLVRDLDNQARRQFQSKTEFIKAAIVTRLQQPSSKAIATPFSAFDEAE